MIIAVILLTAQVTAAGELTSKELVGTWLMGVTGADNVYGTFRPDFSYTITHAEPPRRHGTWKLSDDGRKLEMTDTGSGSSGVTIIRGFDGRLLHVTISNSVAGAWEKVRRVPHSKHGPTQT
jgi:hypothetical protein